MPSFKYKGYDSTGAKVDGEISGASLDEVERRVASQEITIISILPGRVGATSSGSTQNSPKPKSKGKSKITDNDVAGILRDLSIMAETGVPFVEALDAVSASARTPAIQAGLKHLRNEIISGKGLAGGMKASGLFPSLVCDMVKVAEDGGRLDRALASGATYMERSAALRKKVMNAMLYPCVLSVIAFLAVSVLVLFVLPKFETIFSKMGANVPVTTRLMLQSSEYVRSHPGMTLGIFVAGAIALKLILKSPTSRRALGFLIMRFPGIGDLLKKLALSRAFQSIATLLSSNVSLMAALEHGAKVSANSLINEALMKARSRVEHGVSLSESLAETKAFPSMLVQMVSVGERTGRLAPLMLTTASHMEEDVDNRLKALVSIVEPVMIVVMGSIVGLITVSIIMPIYSVVENIK